MTVQNQKKWITGISAVVILTLIAMAAIAGCATNTLAGHDTGSTSGTMAGQPDGRDLFPEKAYPEYAHGYSVEYHGTYKVVRVFDPWGRASGNHTYLLVQRGEKVPEGYPDARVFYIPLESVITLSVSHASYLGAINETASIRGHNGLSNIFDEAFRERANAGEITEVGSGTLSMNNPLKTETMIELSPDAVFCSASGYPEYDDQQKLVEAGLRPVVAADWMENDPLARAEWIKFYSLFFNREEEADDYFRTIEENYLLIKEKAAGAAGRPTLFSGFEYQGTWYASGGESYVAQLFRDAGGDYLFSDNSGAGELPLDFEVVYDRAHDADFYINIGMTGGVEDILARDPRYANFDAVKNGAIYHFDARTNEYGSLDYWQSGTVRPDVILKDLVKILHPDLLPDHELYYYRHISAGTTGDNS